MKISSLVKVGKCKVAYFLFAIILLISNTCLFNCERALGKTKEDIATGRIINVVYDDSGSMVKSHGNYILRWSQAKYSLEVFAAMLGSKDVLNVYPMSLEGGLGYSLSGKDSNRVKTVHNMNGKFRNTPFTTVTSAGGDLVNSSSKAEKWLVIITDGEFDDGATPMSTVEKTINSYLKKGIKVVFLAIGDDVKLPKGDPSKGFYTEKAEDGVDVLKKVTNIANQIFSHLVIPDENISVSGKKYKFSLDIPVDQIIVFAQGDKISIGNLDVSGKTITPTETENVKYSDTIPDNYPDAIVDNTLKGVVVSYEAGLDSFPDGVYEISVSGAEVIEFYYKPGVIVNVDLFYKGNAIQQGEVLYVGDYDVKMNFVNPITNMPVSSKLLKDAIFSLKVDNNGNELEIDGSSESIHLELGSVRLTATAILPGQVMLKDQKDYEVIPEPRELKLEVQKPKESYESREIAEGVTPFTLLVKDVKENRYLTEEEWDATEISMETKGGIKWDIKRGKDVSTWELLPVSTDGSFTGIQAGDLIFNISAGYQIDNLYAYGSEDLKLVVIPYTGSKLVLVAEPGRRSYSMDDLEEQQEGVKVTVYAEDDDTHERKALSEEMLRNLKIEFSLQGEKSKLELFTEEDSGGNSFRIYPRYYKGDPLNTDEGIYTVNCKAQTTEGEKYYTGEVQFELDIGKLSLCKHLRLIAPRLIAIGIILFILFGYVKKNRIRKKGLHPHNIAQNRKTSGDKKIKKSFLSVILPYVSEVATVRSYDSGYQCKVPDLKIKAASKSSFRIINKNLDVNTFEIDGVRYEKYQDVKKRKFSYGGFKITSIDTTTRTKLGSFVFR